MIVLEGSVYAFLTKRPLYPAVVTLLQVVCALIVLSILTHLFGHGASGWYCQPNNGSVSLVRILPNIIV